MGGCGLSFKKMEIVGVDESRTYKADSAGGVLYNACFELSLVPPSKWMQIYEGKNRISERGKQR